VNPARSNPTRSRHVRSRVWRLAALAAAGAAVLAACGDDDDSASDTTGTVATSAAAPTTGAPATTGPAPTTGAPVTTAGPATTAAPETTAAAPGTTAAAPGTTGAPAGEPVVATAETDLGTILVDAEGFTLYAFLADTAGEPTCTGGCAAAWPPVLVEGEPNVGDLDPTVFSLVESPEGGQQLKAGDWPLYRYAADQAPGDVNGQGADGAWYVVAPDGTVIE
jgi:predicted lipoprotein with Yx(FWY)xxD motif